MDYKKSARIFSLCGMALLVLWLIDWVVQSGGWLTGIGLVIFVFGALQLSKYHRCPHCGKSLRYRDTDNEYCPNCGKRLSDPKEPSEKEAQDK